MNTENTFAMAYKYHTLGRCVIPSGRGADGKLSLVQWKRYQTELPTDAQLYEWQSKLNPGVWAMPTGPVSGCFVIDCDTPAAVGVMEAAGLKPHVNTPRGGSHYYCRLPSWVIPTKAGILPGVDIRGQGGYVNFCGSKGNGSYEVLVMPTDDNLIAFERLPAKLRNVLRPEPKTLEERILAEALKRAQPGNRNEMGLWLACQLRDNRVRETEAKPIMLHYVADVTSLGPNPYTESEAMASLGQAYARPAREPRQSAELKPGVELPEVTVTGRHLRDVTFDAMNALYAANKLQPRIFGRSGTLVRINVDEHGRPFTEVLREAALRGYLARCCDFVRVGAKGGHMAVSPPLDVVRDGLSLDHWEFPSLLGITEAPVMRPDGTVITQPGYDGSTSLYYYPSQKLKVPDIPDKPGEGEIKIAIDLVLEPLCDFPFDGEASRANALATMLMPVVRPMISGPVPLAIIDKPQAGTGASLLAEVIAIIATGRAAAMMAAQKDDEGWRKVITSLLLRGQMVVTIDNVEGTLLSPSLAAALTAMTFEDRILGRSEMVALPNRTAWIATGNNVKLAGDLPRRCIWIRMDAKTARPWQRDIRRFKHPNLTDWVSMNRGEFLAAILTVARAWVLADMPEAP